MIDRRIYRFDRFELDTARRIVSSGDQVAYLTPKLFNLLILLLTSGGRIVTKEEILNTVWRDTAVEEGSISRAMSTLRRMLGENNRTEGLILTVAKLGYRFLPAVEIIATERPEAHPTR